MRQRLIVALFVAFAGSAALGGTAFAGIEPSPFYTQFPPSDLLQARIAAVSTRYTLLATLGDRVVKIYAGDVKPWVTETLRIQALGTINQISLVLDGNDELPGTQAGRMILIADRLSAALVDADVEPPFAPELLLAIAHASPGLGWDDEAVSVLHPSAPSFDILMRISAVLFAPQPEPPGVVADGLGAMDRIAAVLFAPQPEPPGVFSQALNVMDRVSSVLGAPQVGMPDVEAQSLDIMDRLSSALAGNPEAPPPAATIDLMARVSAVLFAPQPEPPSVGQRLSIIDRIAAVLFAPQPEPPSEPYENLGEFRSTAISVLYNVSGVAQLAAGDEWGGGTVPGLTALTQLSKHLQTAASNGDQSRAGAQLGAMFEISRQYVGY